MEEDASQQTADCPGGVMCVKIGDHVMQRRPCPFDARSRLGEARYDQARLLRIYRPRRVTLDVDGEYKNNQIKRRLPTAFFSLFLWLMRVSGNVDRGT